MMLQSESGPHGLSDTDFDSLITRNKPVIFGFHGYLPMVNRLTYRRANRGLQVHGYQEEGAITTAFDMRVRNRLDRFHPVRNAVARLPHLGSEGDYLKPSMRDKPIGHKLYLDQPGQDLPEIRSWKWGETV
jgi:xylulose-5-phosphate/fructose-6-phosphate phosphoketolase